MRRAVVVGAGNMGRKWLHVVAANPDVEPVGVVDLDVDLARSTADSLADADLAVGASLDDVAERTGADVVIDATVPAAHLAVTRQALRRGMAVLGEKPAAATLAEAVALTALAESTGSVFVVSQSRRFNPQFDAIRAWLGGGAEVGAISARFSRAPHFGGFREDMDSPLIVDMAIHLFDMARVIAGGAPRAVYARESNPTWSWFRGDASARAIVEFDLGVDFVFDGTWAGRGADTSWNGHWHVATDRGALEWTGDDPATLEDPSSDPSPVVLEPVEGPAALHGSLRAFVAALDADVVADNEIHDNLHGLVVVEGVLESARTGRRGLVDDVLETARAEALAKADAWGMPDARAALEGWSSVADAISRHRPGSARVVSASAGRSSP